MIRHILFPIIVIIFLTSCAADVGKYAPSPVIAKGEPKDLNIETPFSIINSQLNSEDLPLEFRGIIVNYNEFTQSLVEALKSEYESNNVKVHDSAEKELRVSITKIYMARSAFYFSADIVAEVSHANGAIQVFETHRSSYGSQFMVDSFPTKPLDVAFKDLVSEIIENKNILKYLESR
jgi:hypothetical protein